MKDHLLNLEKALDAGTKAGAFNLQEVIVLVNSLQSVVNFISQYEDLTEKQEVKEEVELETKEQ